MNAHWFDDLSRLLGSGMHRRRVAKALATAGAIGAMARNTARPAAAQRDPVLEKCTQCNQYCEPGSTCYNATACNKCKQTIIAGGVLGAGGVLLAEGGEEAYLAVVATRLGTDDESASQVLGQVEWRDSNRSLTSRRILDYGPLPGDEERGRRVVGLARVSGVEGDVPFLLQVVVADSADGTASTVHLVAGDTAAEELVDLLENAPTAIGLDYEAEGELSSGGLELLRIEFA